MRAPAPAPSPSYNQPSYQRPAPSAYPAPMPQRRPSMWRGVLGGALVGLGLGALFSHFGIGAAAGGMLSSLLMIVLLGLAFAFLVRLFRRKAGAPDANFTTFNQQPMPAGPAPSAWQGGFGQSGANVVLDKPTAQQHQAWGVPAGFDTDAFLRQAKASFIRLQAAWDRNDLADLREFTSPEVYAELQLQIQERNGQPDFTEVVSIDAQLLGIETTERDYLASVQFNGMIRNAPGAPPEPYVEVWNLGKPMAGNGGWVLAGIQQIT
jgi:predicted lipid-binding transport protein (Tim44 family)